MSTVTNSCKLMNNYAKWPVRFVKASGNTVWDEAGQQYLDLTSGLAVTSLGHVPPKVAERLHRQIDTLWHSSNVFEMPLQEELAEKLTAIAGLDRVVFCNSGAEANEAAIKIARRYAQKVKGEQRYKVITFQQSFHGRTLATLTATGQEKVKEGFLPLPEGFITVPYNDIEALKKAVTPDTCAILMELVEAEGGVLPAEVEWVKQVRQLCDEQGILLMIDEVQTGIGRTGTWFAYQQYGIKPDVISVAKGLGSGFPIGAMLAVEHVAEALSPGSHGTTFGGNALAMAAGIATLNTMEEEDILTKVNQLHDYFMKKLNAIHQRHPDKVVGVRGKGLILGIQLTKPVADVLQYAREKKVLMIQAGPEVVRILPSFITTAEEIDHGMAVLEEAITAM